MIRHSTWSCFWLIVLVTVSTDATKTKGSSLRPTAPTETALLDIDENDGTMVCLVKAVDIWHSSGQGSKQIRCVLQDETSLALDSHSLEPNQEDLWDQLLRPASLYARIPTGIAAMVGSELHLSEQVKIDLYSSDEHDGSQSESEEEREDDDSGQQSKLRSGSRDDKAQKQEEGRKRKRRRKGSKGFSQQHRQRQRQRQRQRRHLQSNNTLRLTGTSTVLVLRVSAIDTEPSLSGLDMSTKVFGTVSSIFNEPVGAVSMESIYSDCSHNQLRFVPATGTNIVNGVGEVVLDTSIRRQNPFEVENLVAAAANDRFGPINTYDHVIFCMPPGLVGNWNAYGYIGWYRSVFNDGFCGFPSALVHEVGHNLRLTHSREGTEYGDRSCLMGESYER